MARPFHTRAAKKVGILFFALLLFPVFSCEKMDPIMCDLKKNPCTCDDRDFLFGGTCIEYTGIEQSEFEKSYCKEGRKSITANCIQQNRVGTCQTNLKSNKTKIDYEHY